MSEYVLGVLQSLGHLGIIRLKGLIQGQSLSLGLFVDVSDQTALRVEQDLRVVLEADLDDLVGEAEHDRVLSPHPLLHIHDILHLALRELVWVHWGRLVGFGLFTAFKVASEVLEKCHFLLQLLGVFSEGIFFADVLSVGTSSLVIVKMIAVRIEHDLGGVVKIDTGRFIG
jgi:hypothetical protein